MASRANSCLRSITRFRLMPQRRPEAAWKRNCDNGMRISTAQPIPSRLTSLSHTGFQVSSRQSSLDMVPSCCVPEALTPKYTPVRPLRSGSRNSVKLSLAVPPSRRSSRAIIPSGRESYSRAPTYRAVPSTSSRTSVRSLGRIPSTGSSWTRPSMGRAFAHTASSRRPSMIGGAPSCTSASATSVAARATAASIRPSPAARIINRREGFIRTQR